MEGAQLAKPGMTGQFNHKNRLQEHTQRSAIPLPMYQTVNEGSPHAPQFKSTVVVDEETFVSNRTFAHRKEAEQDVARVAIEGISQKIKHEGVPLIHNDTVFCKSILHEYAVKMKIEKPIYTTAESKGLFPLFITSVAFNGETYTGDEGMSKKESVQIAARAAIESILGSDMGTLMSQIIKSKGRLYAAMHKGNGSCLMQDRNVALRGQAENHSTNSIVEPKEVQSALANDGFPAVAYAEAFSSGQPANAAVVNSILTEDKKLKEEVCKFSGLSRSDTSGSPLPQGDPRVGSTGRVVSIADESCFAQSIQVKKVPLEGLSVVSNESQSIASNSGHKRSKKNKRRTSKKARTDEQSPV